MDDTVGRYVIRIADADSVHGDALWDDAHPELEAAYCLEDLVLLYASAVHGAHHDVTEQKGFQGFPVTQDVLQTSCVLEGLVAWGEDGVGTGTGEVLFKAGEFDGLVQLGKEDGLVDHVQDAAAWPVQHTVNGVEHEVALLLLGADDAAGSRHHPSVEVLV